MFKKVSDQHASNKLLKLLLKTALISSVLIIAVVSYAVSLLYNQHVMQAAEYDAVSVGEAIVALERHQLITTDEQGIEHFGITPAGFHKLDETMLKALAPFDIIKIKVFSKDGRIIYSTDHSIIGKDDSNNPRLQIALSGGISSKLQTKDAIVDLRGEKNIDVDVVETYIPIKSSQGLVLGSFEVYQDVGSSTAKSQEGIAKSLITLSIILAIVFGLSLVIMKIAAKELNLAHNKLHKMATEDTLTGLKNRGAIIGSIKGEISRNIRLSKNEPHPFSLIMIDVDHFKSINDGYGHPVGDRALQEIAKTINIAVRDHDLTGRYGGEEFLLLLPETEQEGATLLAERVRHSIECLDFYHDNEKISLTVSLGVITVEANDFDYEQALKLVDEALYQAKGAGRNRVSVVSSH